jgi:hypothetical protein
MSKRRLTPTEALLASKRRESNKMFSVCSSSSMASSESSNSSSSSSSDTPVQSSSAGNLKRKDDSLRSGLMPIHERTSTKADTKSRQATGKMLDEDSNKILSQIKILGNLEQEGDVDITGRSMLRTREMSYDGTVVSFLH